MKDSNNYFLLLVVAALGFLAYQSMNKDAPNKKPDVKLPSLPKLPQVRASTLVVVTQSNCPACESLKRVIGDGSALPVKVRWETYSPDKHPDVQAVPTMLLLDAGGKEVARSEGVKYLAELLVWIQDPTSYLPTADVPSPASRLHWQKFSEGEWGLYLGEQQVGYLDRNRGHFSGVNGFRFATHPAIDYP